MLVREDRWYLKTRIKSPLCECERIVVAEFNAIKDAGLRAQTRDELKVNKVGADRLSIFHDID